MKSITAVLMIAGTMLAAAPVLADEDSKVHDQIEEVLGDADGFDDTVEGIVEAIDNGDADTLGTLTEFPLGTGIGDIEDTDGLKAHWDELFTPKVRAAFDVEPEELIVTSEGVGFKNGEVWLNHYCVDDACKTTYWALSRINN